MLLCLRQLTIFARFLFSNRVFRSRPSPSRTRHTHKRTTASRSCNVICILYSSCVKTLYIPRWSVNVARRTFNIWS